MMEIKALDVLELKNGKTGTVLEVHVPGQVFLVEFSDENGATEEIRIVKLDEIDRVSWHS